MLDGHHQSEVMQLCKDNSNTFAQKGSALQAKTWYLSDTVKKLFIVNEKTWKAQAIHQLYSNIDTSQNFLYINENIKEEYLEEIKDVQADNGTRFGDAFENWKSKTGKDHTFDVIKYAYCLRDICLKSLRRDKFLQCKSPMLLKRFGNQKQANTNNSTNASENKESYWQ